MSATCAWSAAASGWRVELRLEAVTLGGHRRELRLRGVELRLGLIATDDAREREHRDDHQAFHR